MIDISTWERKAHFEWFNQFANPCVTVGNMMDVTTLLEFCSDLSISSFATIMYSVCTALNSIEQFKYRILENTLIEISNANAAYTSAINDKLFKNCRVSSQQSLLSFCAHVKAESAHNKETTGEDKDFNNITIIDDFYFSCVPWIDFAYLIQPIPDMSIENKSIPRITWGKYTQQDQKSLMMMDITANHALVDGKDIAEAFAAIQCLFNEPYRLLKQES